jgi:uncharacterized protein (TIGR02300 family)
MIKPEWGTKRSCPKCATRFYDLGKEDPVECINCGQKWVPESVLKSKQPLPFGDAAKPDAAAVEVVDDPLADADLDIDIDVDDDGDSPDNDVDLGGDDDLGVAAAEPGEDEN